MRLTVLLYGDDEQGGRRHPLAQAAALQPDWQLLREVGESPEALQRRAEEARGDWLLLLRGDRILKEEDVEALLTAAETAGAALAGPRLLRPDRSFDPSCKRGFPSPGSVIARLLKLDRCFPSRRGPGRYHHTWLSPEDVGAVECLSLRCMLVRGELWRQLEGLDTAFTEWGADMDFCTRAAGAGALTLYCGTVVSPCREGSSAPAGKSDGRHSRVSAAKGLEAYYRKHLPPRCSPVARWFMRAGLAAFTGADRLRLKAGRIFTGMGRIIRRIPAALRFLRNFGLRATFRKTLERILDMTSAKEYGEWRKKRQLTGKDMRVQREYRFADPPLISVVTPVYNTPEPYLEEMAASVRNQTYGCWELILADGGSSLPGLRKRMETLAADDSRIRVLFFEDNLGISGNTNRGIEAARGEIIAFLDHDDILTPDALFEVAWAFREEGAEVCYSDEDKIDEQDTENPYGPFFKPDYSPETLTSMNYISHFSAVSAALLRKTGLLRPEFDGSQDHELMLRLSRSTSAFVHIPRVLYHWRQFSSSVSKARQQQCVDAGIRAIAEHWTALGMEVEQVTYAPEGYHTRFVPRCLPRVSVLIPNKDHAEDLRRCVDGLLRAAYPDWEALVIENHSVQPETFALYRELGQDPRIRVLEWDKPFNYAAVNNFAAARASGELLLLLNNDVEMRSPLWLQEMVVRLRIQGVGAVGGRLLYPDGRLQHGGVVTGIGGVAGHIHVGVSGDANGYYGRLAVLWNVGAVTGALLLTPASLYRQLGGLEEALAVAFNDVDYCIKVRQAGHRILYVPEAEGVHRESVSRGYEDTSEKQERFRKEAEFMMEKWGDRLTDPYYNPNLTLTSTSNALRNEILPPTRLHP